MTPDASHQPQERERLDKVVLDYMLWGFDETPYRVLRNQMVVTRKPDDCCICMQPIPVGSRVRAQSEVYDGKAKTFRLCPTCCEAIILDDVDGDCLRMEERTQIGMRKAAERWSSRRTQTGIRVSGPHDPGHC